MLFLLQQPIVVEVMKQPPPTAEISYGSVLLNAVGVIGVVLVSGISVGLVIGGLFILYRRRQDAAAPPTDPGHAKLRI